MKEIRILRKDAFFRLKWEENRPGKQMFIDSSDGQGLGMAKFILWNVLSMYHSHEASHTKLLLNSGYTMGSVAGSAGL